MRVFAVASLIVASVFWMPSVHTYQIDSYQQQPDESDLDTHGHYVNRGGNSVHSPAHSRSGTVPTGATARCRDGSYRLQPAAKTLPRRCQLASGVARDRTRPAVAPPNRAKTPTAAMAQNAAKGIQGPESQLPA